MRKILTSLFVVLITLASCSKDNTDPTPTPDPTPSPKTPDMIDLGLSVKWASFNIGATKPEEKGKYFAWGDVKGQTWDGSNWSGGGFNAPVAFEEDVNNNLAPEYDAAHVLLGGDWRMPTKDEFQELLNNCTYKSTTNYNDSGVAGLVFTSKKVGYTEKSIFFPAAGVGSKNGIYSTGELYYWTKTNSTKNSAYCLYGAKTFAGLQDSFRKSGLTIRPVSK